ncbi:hypothetical protein [Actinoplanes sp. NPDC049681]|uniref:hypothetical protein n=1 Tax=Actinoplanes sp. NPDC049681 TaxID=3363905 RepID=UPI0037AC1A91
MTGPKHAAVYPPGERGRRILWRTVTMGLFFALEVGGFWVAHVLGWADGLVGALIAVPYWTAVTSVWSRYGPEMPGLG